jgi:hypothetical protein
MLSTEHGLCDEVAASGSGRAIELGHVGQGTLPPWSGLLLEACSYGPYGTDALGAGGTTNV